MSVAVDLLFKSLRGDLEPLIHTEICVEWKKNHSNCKGCVSEDVCHEYVSRIADLTHKILYQDRDDDVYKCRMYG